MIVSSVRRRGRRQLGQLSWRSGLPSWLLCALATAATLASVAATPGLAGARARSTGRVYGAGGPVAPFARAGRWITDALGRVVILHGLNMVDKLPPYYPAALGFGTEDVRFLAAEDFSSVRLGIILKGLEPEPGVFDDAYLEHIVQTVDLLERYGIVPLLDFHQDMYNERFDGEGFPDWMVQDDGLPAEPNLGFPGNYEAMPALWRAYDHFWQNDPTSGGSRLQDAYAAAWAHVAARFRADRHLVGYDIFNEPFAGSQWASCTGPQGCPLFETGPLTAMTSRVIAAIRPVDPNHLIWSEPQVSYDFGTPTYLTVGGNGVGFTFHDYCLLNQPGTPPASAQAQAMSCPVLEQAPFTNALKQSSQTGDALLLSEFGATDDLRDLQRMVNLADTNMMPWQEWAFWNRDVCCARPIEGIVNDITKPPTGTNVKWDKLAILVRPYPAAIAGTPTRFLYTPQTHTFTLSYTTNRAAGGHVGPRVVTEVRVPALDYPNGYRATASGARSSPSRGATRCSYSTTPARVA